LTKNALKFSSGKPVHIITAYQNETKRLQVQFKDEGKGLSQAELSALDKLLKSKTEADIYETSRGTGLVACKQILEQYGGTLEVFSDGEGKGSTFQFSIKMNLLKASQNQGLSTSKKIIKNPERASIASENQSVDASFDAKDSAHLPQQILANQVSFNVTAGLFKLGQSGPKSETINES